MSGREGQFARQAELTEDCLAGGGQMGALMRDMNWGKTPLGPVSSWPQSLRTSVSICLNSLFPILVWWGPELIMLYNDAYRPILGTTKHPRALGAPGREIWPEIWSIIGPMLHGVLATGQATWSDDKLLMLDRNGYLEECYFAFSYSAIRQEDGQVGGVFCAVRETTGRVLGERRLLVLRDLAYHATQAKTKEQACSAAIRTLAGGRADTPFAFSYILEARGTVARLCEGFGLEPGSEGRPDVVDLSGPQEADPWGFAEVLKKRERLVVKDVATRMSSIPPTDWGIPPERAIVMPLREPGSEDAGAILVAGLNPCRAWDQDYRSFFDLAAGHISAAIGNAAAYEEERRRTETLLELDRAKTAFFGNVSHEFRTPLTLMLGPLEELLRKELPGTSRRELEMVHRNSRRLLKLVNTLLDFARMEAARVDAAYEPTDLAAITADLASSFRSAVEKAGMRLIVDCPPLPEQVYVDHEMWEKIVLNLLSNAFKFTFEGEIAISLRWINDHVELTVRDTGTGIPRDALPHIFDRFRRVPDARSRTHEGTGIGLALVKELVLSHAGSIDVASELGRGSTFTVSIPTGVAHLPKEHIRAAKTRAASMGVAPFVEEALRWLPDTEDDREAAGEFESESVYVLLADDNADMRGYLRRLLSQNWTVEAVADGAAALERALSNPPGLVLADVMMSGLNGFELLKQLRAHPATREIPVILLSARAGEEARVEGIESGADDYLVKPFAARELIARVRTHLQLAQLRRQAAQALRESEERFRTMADGLPLMIWVHDAEGKQLFVNRTFGEFFGVTPEQMYGDKWQPLMHPDDADRYITEFLASVREQRPFHGEVRVMRQDGHWRLIESFARPRFSSSGEFLGHVGTSVDVTERREMEEALRQSEERLRLATDIGGIGTWYLDLREERLELSERCHAIFGLQRGIRISLDYVISLVHPGDRTKVKQATAQALSTTEEVHTDYRVTRPDGSVRWVMMRCRSVTDEFGRIRANIGVAMDITARKEFEQHLIDFNARLEQRAAERTEEVRRLAEHLRALTTELTQAEQRERKRVATILHDHIQQLLVAARMQIGIGRRSLTESGLIQTLLRADRHVADAISASRSLTTELSPPILHEAGLAAGLDWLADQVKDQHQWTVEVTSEPGAEPESEDVRLFLFGAVRELLFNACKYSGVTTARVKMMRASDKWVKIVVEDQGQGFNPEAIKKEHRPTSGGFGLFSIQQRLSYIGGEMEIESAPDQGTRVTLLAPLGEVRPDDTLAAVKGTIIGHAPSIQERSQGTRVRVIVVDDHKVMREGLRSMLQLEPDILVVGEAEDGEQAIELARQLQPDIILMDITMPRMGGLEATRVICSHLPHVKVVGLSMHVDTAIIESMTQAGACAYLTKDEPMETVISTIRGLKSPPVSTAADRAEHATNLSEPGA